MRIKTEKVPLYRCRDCTKHVGQPWNIPKGKWTNKKCYVCGSKDFRFVRMIRRLKERNI